MRGGDALRGGASWPSSGEEDFSFDVEEAVCGVAEAGGRLIILVGGWRVLIGALWSRPRWNWICFL